MKVIKPIRFSFYLILGMAIALSWLTLQSGLGYARDANNHVEPTPIISTLKGEAEARMGSLRSLAQQRGIQIGAAARMEPFYNDVDYRALLAEEFNSLTPENAMKFARLHPERDRYDFTDAAALVTFAKEHQMQVHGHVLVWHRTLPDWLTEQDWSREALTQVLQAHIFTVASRFRGQLQAWDVVNEAIGRGGRLRNSIWLNTLGPEYIEQAFRWAHEADPNAQLFYNDYGGEGMGAKSDAIYALVQDLVQRDVPISGVGFQMHVSIQNAPDPTDVAANIRRLNDLGLSVRITEMDVQIQGDDRPEDERLQAQATIYRNMMEVCLAAADCTGLTTWGISDQYSWIRLFYERPDDPLLFDEDYQPKDAYHALIDALKP